MRKLFNGRISKVKKDIKEDLSVTIKLEFTCPVTCPARTTVRCFTHTFYNIKENNEFKKLMQYADTKKIKKLNGQVLRLVVDDYYEDFLGFGDPLWDEFILFSEPGKLYTEAELNKQG